MAARQATVAVTVVCVVPTSAAAAIAAAATRYKDDRETNHDVPHIVLALVPETFVGILLRVLLLQSFGKLNELFWLGLKCVKKLCVLVLRVTHRPVDKSFHWADVIDSGLAVVALKGAE